MENIEHVEQVLIVISDNYQGDFVSCYGYSQLNECDHYFRTGWQGEKH